MIDAFARYVETLAKEDDADSGARELLLKDVVAENHLAALWRRILLVGASHPLTLGKEILPLGYAPAVLTNFDTSVAAGEYLKAVFPGLSAADRGRIERALLSIPDSFEPGQREKGERTRNRLLGCLRESDLVSDRAKGILRGLQKNDAVPRNEPAIRFGGVTSSRYTEEEYLADEGVPVNAEPNRTIRGLADPAQQFARRYENSTPPSEEIAAILPALESLRQALSRSEAEGVHQKQSDHAWGHLAEACSCVAKAEMSCGDGAIGVFTRDVLLEASLHPDPIARPELNWQFDEHPSWGKPSVRIAAAEGLILMARHGGCADTAVQHAIESLSVDPVPAVRFQIAERVNALYNTAPELMWTILNRMSEEEESRGVLQGLLVGPISRLAGGEHQERVIALVKSILARVSMGPGSSRVRSLCIGILAELYIWRGNATCRDVVLSITNNPVSHADEAHSILVHLREPLTHGPVTPNDPKQDEVRVRARDSFLALLRSGKRVFSKLDASHTGVPFDQWSERDLEETRLVARILDSIGMEIFHASGAYGKTGRETSGIRESETRALAERFYRETGPILDELSDVGIPSLVHHLLQTLEFLAPIDPAGVFVRIGTIVEAGHKGGYEYESLASDLIVRLVECYLAEYPELLREDENCRRTLLAILDRFVVAGWPSARRLTYRLDEIFR
jgi:hypothetical protein